MRAMIAMIAMRARIRAYSARPWPSSSRLRDEIRALKNDMLGFTSFRDELLGGKTPEGRATLRSSPSGVKRIKCPIPTILASGCRHQEPSGSEGSSVESKSRRDRSPSGSDVFELRELDRVTDVAQDARDLAAQEDEGDDCDDRDEGEDQRVLCESLAFLVPTNRGEELLDERHVAQPP